ncbi:MAG: hypothetical protein ACREQL_10590 [Candidatus Binatia bacterium]
MRTTLIATAIVTALVAVRPAAADEWTPQAWANESTVELRTTDRGEQPHWFPVWFTVLDGQLYARLGSRAAGRFDRNVTKPVLAVRIAGKTFEQVRGVVVPEMADQVAVALAQKYWGDLFVAFVNHPYTLRLEPEPSGGS